MVLDNKQDKAAGTETKGKGPPVEVSQKVRTPLNRVVWLDVSQLYRPEGKTQEEFRIFDEKLIGKHPLMERVFQTYQNMHTYQTVEFVQGKIKEWSNFDHFQATIMDALDLLNKFIDGSDPDVDVPNIVHAFQTAERIRETHPEEDWFHLTGLIHDLGKVMGLYGEKQWATGGDTFVVGCKPGNSVVFVDSTFQNNPDLKDPRYNTELGMYKEHCGLKNLLMSWGHDEYMYRVLKAHPGMTLPEEALYMIRFHSFYPWHTGGDYWNLADDYDREMYYWIKEFNKYDLYSKTDKQPDMEKLKPYYQSLIDKYIPGIVKF
jgi:inositol oxygenase